MKIKTRLSLYFTLISSGALLLVLTALYVSVYSYSREDFYDRLTDRANVAAQLYLKADEVDADSLMQIQQKYLVKLNGEVIRVYNKDNRSAFNTHNDVYWSDDVIEQVRQEGYIKYKDGKREVVGKYFKDNQGNFVILVSGIDSTLATRTRTMGEIAIVLFIIFSGGLFFAGQIFANKALKPVKNVIAQMSQIRSSNLHLRVVASNSKDEIAELINNFNSLLEHLENAFDLQKTFIANASHELRTPLTSIMGEVDVALSKKRELEEYERVLTSIAADGMHLQETITGLMELAQVDLNYTQAKLSLIRVDELLWELHDSWLAKKGPGMLNLKFGEMPDDEAALEVLGNKSLLYIAINNIVDNAFKYSAMQPVDISFDANAGRIKLAVSDKGIGINAADAENIFRSFYRAGNVKDTPGSGIGLYITDKIIHLCNGSLKVISDGETGSTFEVEFKKIAAPQF